MIKLHFWAAVEVLIAHLSYISGGSSGSTGGITKLHIWAAVEVLIAHLL